jgi:hypothetical protein
MINNTEISVSIHSLKVFVKNSFLGIKLLNYSG